MKRIPPPPPLIPRNLRVRCHCGEALFHAPRVRRPEFLSERRLTPTSRPVTGISGAEVYETLDGQATIDLWAKDATGWISRCPRPGCGTERRLEAFELRQLVAEASTKLFITLPAPMKPRRGGV